MNSLKRLFPYVLRQWPLLIVIVLSAALTSIMMSGTIATVGPLIKVMMNEEGMHTWVNRTLTTNRYGIDFLLHRSDPNAGFYLTVANVKEGRTGALAGIQTGDMIRSVTIGTDANSANTSNKMLKALAFAPGEQELQIVLARPQGDGLTTRNITLKSPEKPGYYQAVAGVMSYVPEDDSKNKERAVIVIVILMIGVTFARCLFRFLQDYSGEKVVQTTIANLREDTFGHALNIPVGYYVLQGSSDTVSRMVQDTGTIGSGLKVTLTKAIREPLTAASSLACAFYLSPKLTLIFMCSAPLTVFVVSNFGKKMKKATKKSLANWAKVLAKLEESIIALRVVKIYNRQGYEHARFQERNRKLLKQQIRVSKVDSATDPVMETLGVVAISGGIVFGAHWVFTQNMAASSFFLLLGFLASCAEAVRRAGDVWTRIQQANAAAERVLVIMDEPGEKEKDNAVELAPLSKVIEFKDIWFTYPGTERPILKGINLNVRAGQNVAIVGPNGSGKTTLVNLIPRFYNPDKGRILIDGQDISEASLKSLRGQMAMVTQNVLTFNDTIAANIAYGKPDASRAEIIEAAKRSYAHEFIAPLPDGYDTIIGEQGAGLSGGQLQRIVIARAILKNPPIMIFDEAMSQIDADSEAKIHKALDEFMKNRTSFVIAHRFSTVIKADMIVVVNEGQIIAQGVHEKLIANCGLYQKLYQTQLLKDSA